MEFLIVFLGGGLGSAMRHGVNVLAARYVASGFPFGTLAINVLGSFVMGLIVELLALRMGLPQNLRLFLTTGILGGFTTFSTFSLEA
ncbi:CrcB family protein, partial [Xenophilus sp.]